MYDELTTHNTHNDPGPKANLVAISSLPTFPNLSNLCSTSIASSSLPCMTSHRGDSGSSKSDRVMADPGIEGIATIQRQPEPVRAQSIAMAAIMPRHNITYRGEPGGGKLIALIATQKRGEIIRVKGKHVRAELAARIQFSENPTFLDPPRRPELWRPGELTGRSPPGRRGPQWHSSRCRNRPRVAP